MWGGAGTGTPVSQLPAQPCCLGGTFRDISEPKSVAECRPSTDGLFSSFHPSLPQWWELPQAVSSLRVPDTSLINSFQLLWACPGLRLRSLPAPGFLLSNSCTQRDTWPPCQASGDNKQHRLLQRASQPPRDSRPTPGTGRGVDSQALPL